MSRPHPSPLEMDTGLGPRARTLQLRFPPPSPDNSDVQLLSRCPVSLPGQLSALCPCFQCFYQSSPSPLAPPSCPMCFFLFEGESINRRATLPHGGYSSLLCNLTVSTMAQFRACCIVEDLNPVSPHRSKQWAVNAFHQCSSQPSFALSMRAVFKHFESKPADEKGPFSISQVNKYVLGGSHAHGEIASCRMVKIASESMSTGL